jgi:hypothetical protein
MDDQRQKTATTYFTECQTINDNYENKWEKWLTSLNEHNVATKINVAQQRIDEHKQNVSDDKKALLADLKRRYNVHDAIWKGALEIVQGLKEFNKESRIKDIFKGAHDPKIPVWFCAMIKKELVARGHNPAAVTLKCRDTNSYVIHHPVYSFSLHKEGGLCMEQESYGKIVIDCDSFLKEFRWPGGDYHRGFCMFAVKSMQKLGALPLYQAINAFQENDISRMKLPEKEIEMLNIADLKRSFYQIAFRDEESARCIASYYSSAWQDNNRHCISDYKRLKDIHFRFRCIAWLKEYCLF